MRNDYSMNSVEALKSNIKHEKNILREMYIFSNQLEIIENLEKRGFKVNIREKTLLSSTVNSLLAQLKILNNSIPEIMKKISSFKELPSPEEITKEELVRVEYKHPALTSRETLVTIKGADKMRFLKELSLTDESVRRLKKEYKSLVTEIEEFKKPSLYAKTSNKFFSGLTDYLFERGYFPKINKELRKANLYFLSRTYVSMAFFSSFVAFLVSILLLMVLLFFSFSFGFPFLVGVDEPILLRLLKNFWIIFAIPILTFFAFYYYPSSEKKSISSKINQELPFGVIHMSAIAGSGVEPTKIFKIIVLSREYPNLRKEIKKLINEINIYGYDLVTALKNSARVTSSAKLAELFKGLATTISSGGDLKDFLEKRAETLVFDYRIEREKYTRIAETFMDIYISVVIAAPMIMTMLLVMMSLIEFNFGLSLNAITLLMVLGVVLINIFFLIFLHLRQPEF